MVWQAVGMVRMAGMAGMMDCIRNLVVELDCKLVHCRMGCTGMLVHSSLRHMLVEQSLEHILAVHSLAYLERGPIVV